MRLNGTTIVTLATGFNLLLTLGNQAVLAYLFGAGTSMDAFLACGAVPFVVLNLAIGDLGYILIPVLLQFTCANETRRAVSSTFASVLALSFLLTAGGVLGHSAILHMTTAPNMPATTFELANSMAPVMWGIIGLTVLSSYLTGLHHFYRFFTAAALTLALPYLGMMLGGVIGAHRAGIHAVVWGWFAGTLMRTIVLYFSLPTPRPGLARLRHPATAQLARSLLPLGVAMLPFAALPSIDVFWASRLPVGSISYLGYSTRIAIAIALIVVQGLSVVLFPDLSEDARNGRLDAVRQKSSDAILFIIACIVPLAALAYLLDGPLLAVLLQRGRFTPDASAGVLDVLPWYLLGTLPMAMMNIVSRSFFALRDYRTPALTGLAGLAVYVGISGALIGRFSFEGIGISYVVFWIVIFVLQTAMLGRRVGSLFSADILRRAAELFGCAAVASGAVVALRNMLPNSSGALMHAAVAASTFVTVYLLMGVGLFRIPQYAILLESVHRRTFLRRLRIVETDADFVPGSYETAILAGAHNQDNG